MGVCVCECGVCSSDSLHLSFVISPGNFVTLLKNLFYGEGCRGAPRGLIYVYSHADENFASNEASPNSFSSKIPQPFKNFLFDLL